MGMVTLETAGRVALEVEAEEVSVKALSAGSGGDRLGLKEGNVCVRDRVGCCNVRITLETDGSGLTRGTGAVGRRPLIRAQYKQGVDAFEKGIFCGLRADPRG